MFVLFLSGELDYQTFKRDIFVLILLKQNKFKMEENQETQDGFESEEPEKSEPESSSEESSEDSNDESEESESEEPESDNSDEDEE